MLENCENGWIGGIWRASRWPLWILIIYPFLLFSHLFYFFGHIQEVARNFGGGGGSLSSSSSSFSFCWGLIDLISSLWKWRLSTGTVLYSAILVYIMKIMYAYVNFIYVCLLSRIAVYGRLIYVWILNLF